MREDDSRPETTWVRVKQSSSQRFAQQVADKEGSSTGSSRPGKGPRTNNFQKKKSGFAWKKGKGRKFKKRYMRSAGMEEEEEDEQEQDEEDEVDTYIRHLGKEIKKMDKKTKIRVLAALQEDF